MIRRDLIKSGAALGAIPLLGSCSSNPGIRLVEGLPRSGFGADATAEQVTAGLDLGGKIAVVTGCNSGIGFETMRVLAMRGAHVIGTGRSLDKAADACRRVTGEATPVVLELADFRSVVDCSSRIAAMVPRIDILVGNAGMIPGPALEQVDGIEKSFAVNHLGHFILINRLLYLVNSAPQGRVVMVSSSAAFDCPGIEFDNLAGERDYDRRRFYSQSKLANALFALALAGKLADLPATSNSVHPGVIVTNIARHEPWLLRNLFSTFGVLFTRTIAEGAATSCYVAGSPALKEINGYFFMDCNPIRLEGINHLYDVSMAWQLWDISERLTGPYLG